VKVSQGQRTYLSIINTWSTAWCVAALYSYQTWQTQLHNMSVTSSRNW